MGHPRTLKAKRILSTGQVAKICGVAPRTVSNWIDTGKLPGYRIPASTPGGKAGRDRRVHRDALSLFMQRHQMPTDMLETECLPAILLIGAGNWSGCPIHLHLPADDYRFVVASDAFGAGVLIEQLRPETVLIDLAMGRREGLAIARQLRALPGNGPAMVIALASEDETGFEELSQARFTDYFRKPFDPQLLAERIGGGSRD